jgi:hypothetical protein
MPGTLIDGRKNCRAWVKFAGATGAIVAGESFNVSSVTRNAVGDYTVNFASQMPYAGYVMTGTASDAAVSDAPVVCSGSALQMLAASNRIKVYMSNTRALFDPAFVTVAFNS